MNFFADEFDKKHKTDVRSSAKAMAKLRSQALSTKHVLR